MKVTATITPEEIAMFIGLVNLATKDIELVIPGYTKNNVEPVTPAPAPFDWRTFNPSLELLDRLINYAGVNNKIAMIKEVRAATGCKLEEAKYFVESTRFTNFLASITPARAM